MASEITDNFNRASLGAAWTQITGTQSFPGSTVIQPTSDPWEIVHSTALSSIDQYVQVKFYTVTGNNQRAQIMLNVANLTADPLPDMYDVYFRNTSPYLLVFRRVGGTLSQIAAGDSGDALPNGWSTIKATVEHFAGYVEIKAYINDSLVFSYQDSDASRLTSGSYSGIRLGGYDGGQFDDFEAGVFGESTTTSTTTSTSTSTSTTTSTTTSTSTTLGVTGAYAFGEQTPTNGETAISWATWEGSGVVTGDPNWGKLGLAVGQNGYSRVYDFGNELGKLITITHNLYGTGQGTATTEIRGQAASFLATDGTPTWETYTTPTTKTWRYIQVRLVAS